MTALERDLYEAVEDYIATTYNQASAADRSAVGFVMTIYRRRLASSFRALRTTLEKHLRAIREGDRAALVGLDEDAPDDETADEAPDAEEVAEIERRVLAAEERADIERLLDRIRACPPDSKLSALRSTLAALREAGHEQVMVFTQYTDTMDFLRDELRRNGGSGGGGSGGGGGDGDGQTAADVLLGTGRGDPGCERRLARNRTGRRQAPVPARRGRPPALHRCRRRGPQLPVLRCARQLRHALEPDAGRAAHRTHRPPRPTVSGHPRP